MNGAKRAAQLLAAESKLARCPACVWVCTFLFSVRVSERENALPRVHVSLSSYLCFHVYSPDTSSACHALSVCVVFFGFFFFAFPKVSKFQRG